MTIKSPHLSLSQLTDEKDDRKEYDRVYYRNK
jgi:hypothetical protein